jgi:hypothetical protein
VTGGRFHGNFTVPRDVTLGGTLGRAVAYYHNELGDGVVSLDSVLFADRVAEAADTIPPQIQLFFDQRAWRPGDRISPKPLLIVDLFDSSGLNLTGAMGHGVALSLDGGKAMDLTPYFAYNLDSYQTGTLETRIGPLTPGIHQLEIQAWDGFNNLTVQKTEVEVIPSSDGFSIERVYNWPNPFRESTQLTFTVNQPADYEILIYTVGGRLIWDWKGAALAAGMIADAVWDGRDHAGRRVGNGVYLYKVKAWNGDGAPAEGLGKIVYVR